MREWRRARRSQQVKTLGGSNDVPHRCGMLNMLTWRNVIAVSSYFKRTCTSLTLTFNAKKDVPLKTGSFKPNPGFQFPSRPFSHFTCKRRFEQGGRTWRKANGTIEKESRMPYEFITDEMGRGGGLENVASVFSNVFVYKQKNLLRIWMVLLDWVIYKQQK